MAFNLFATVGVALILNRVVFGKFASLIKFWSKEARDQLLIDNANVLKAER